MRLRSLQHVNEDNTVDCITKKLVELSDEQLHQVSGGYIIAGPIGELDWLRRQWYYKTHPGMMEPLVKAN